MKKKMAAAKEISVEAALAAVLSEYWRHLSVVDNMFFPLWFRLNLAKDALNTMIHSNKCQGWMINDQHQDCF